MQVNYWVSRARPVRDYMPPMKDFDDFVVAYRQWFDALNPSWRFKNNAGRWIASGNGDWDSFKKPGPNGLLSVLACLKWWIDEEQRLEKVSDSWVEAVADLVWVLLGLVETMPKCVR